MIRDEGAIVIAYFAIALCAGSVGFALGFLLGVFL